MSKRRIHLRVFWLMLAVVAVMALTYLIVSQLGPRKTLGDSNLVLIDTPVESITLKLGKIAEPEGASYRCRKGLYRDEIIIVRFDVDGKTADFMYIAVLDDRYSTRFTKTCDEFTVSDAAYIYIGQFDGKTAAKIKYVGTFYYFLLDSGTVADALSIVGISSISG